MKKRFLYLFAFCIFVCSFLIACDNEGGVKHEHVFEQNVSQAYLKIPSTCDNKSIYYKSCSCGETSSETFEYGNPLGHSYGNWESNDDGSHTKKCSNDSLHTIIEECNDNNKDHKCDVCNYKLTNCVDNDNNNYCDICNVKLNNNNQNKDNFYNITFLDENGNLLKIINVKEGIIPSYSYTKVDTEEWDYTFVGWATALNGTVLNKLPEATKDVSYYAVVSKTKKSYNVSFNTLGAGIISSQRIDYGSVAIKPSDPKKEGYVFVCWTTDEQGNNVFDWTTLITGDITLYAKWNIKVNIKGLLETLLESYYCSPYSYIPASLQPSSSNNHIASNQIITDYSKFINVSNITSHGYGEQLNMIIENINQSSVFFNALSVVEGLSAVSIVGFNNYLDNNPSNTAYYTFKNGIYNVAINYDGKVLTYVLDYTTNLLGEHTAQIALSMNTLTDEKVVRLQIGDSNALKYIMNENSYQFAIRYLGVRRAYFSVKRNNDDTVEGNIYEFLTVKDVEVKSVADFYINKKYTTVVGNKANGMLGWTGTIVEVYDNLNGKLVGYEVEETLSKITYNSLWFDLDTIKGINSIKYVEKTDSTPEHFYINGSSKAWESKKVGGLGTKMLSRRFDIEFRTQYFYTLNEQTNEYEKVEVKVPMLFVQEEVYDDLVDDIKETNNIAVNVELKEADLNEILSSYDSYLPIFKIRKDNITNQMILDIIGDRIKFN